MGIFLKSKDEGKLAVVFDIGSYSIGGAVFYLQKSGSPKIIYSTREPISFEKEINFDKFSELWDILNKQFECLNSKDIKDSYYNYLTENCAIRFSRKNEFIPNMEVKFPKNDLDIWTLKNKKEVILNNKKIFISPMELQIPFKIFLGSEKDIEDARYLYNIFKNKIDINLLKEFNRKLNIEDLFNKYLR